MAKNSVRLRVKEKRDKFLAAPRQEAQSDLQPGQWVERWLVVQGAAQWLERSVVRRRGFCEDSFVAPPEHGIQAVHSVLS